MVTRANLFRFIVVAGFGSILCVFCYSLGKASSGNGGLRRESGGAKLEHARQTPPSGPIGNHTQSFKDLLSTDDSVRDTARQKLGKSPPDEVGRELFTWLRANQEVNLELIALAKKLDCSQFLRRDLFSTMGKLLATHAESEVLQGIELFDAGNEREVFVTNLIANLSGDRGLKLLEGNPKSFFENELMQLSNIASSRLQITSFEDVRTALTKYAAPFQRKSLIENLGMQASKVLDIEKLASLKLDGLSISEMKTFLSHVLAAKVSHGRDEVLHALKNRTLADLDPNVVSPAVRIMFETSLSTGTKWAEQAYADLPKEYQDQAAPALTSQWIYRDAMQASAWVKQLPRGSSKDWAIQRVVTYLVSNHDVESAKAWVEAASTEDFKRRLSTQIESQIKESQ